MRVTVVGGGLLGLSVGYRLSKQGHSVRILESGDRLGGLTADVEVGGSQVDRFYHCILNSDDHLLKLVDEVGLSDELRMKPVRAGFFWNGKTYSISTPMDLLRFPPLGPLDRMRLIRSLLACRRIKDWQTLEQIDVSTWLRRLSGDKVFETVWRPLLSAKFNGSFSEVPATYIWSRTVRMTDTRSAGGSRELAGHLVGGYRTLAERLAQQIRDNGGDVQLNVTVDGLECFDGSVRAVHAGDRVYDSDSVVLTTPLPISARLLRGRKVRGHESSELAERIDAYSEHVERVEGYLGVICVLLMLKRPLSPYYTLYLADSNLPFTAVIETTNLIDPQLLDGHHLVYLPKYLSPKDELFDMSDHVISTWFVDSLRRIYPDLHEEDIVAAPVFRAPFVEPLHPLGHSQDIPSTRTPVQGLYLGSTKHFYPRLNNADAVTRLGARLAEEVVDGATAGRNSARSVDESLAASTLL